MGGLYCVLLFQGRVTETHLHPRQSYEGSNPSPEIYKSKREGMV